MPDRLDDLKPDFLALTSAERFALVREVRQDRLVRKTLPRVEKTKKRQEAAKVEKLEEALKTVREDWLPLLLKENLNG